VTSIYLNGIDPGEIIETIHARRAADDPGQRRTRPAALSPASSATACPHARPVGIARGWGSGFARRRTSRR
jgi:hypothetical protein